MPQILTLYRLHYDFRFSKYVKNPDISPEGILQKKLYIWYTQKQASYHLHLADIVLRHNQKQKTVMKLTNVIATGTMLLAFALSPVVSIAQDKQADKKDLHQDQKQLDKNKAQRNEAIKKGEPKKAVKDEKKVQADKKDIHHDRKDLHKDKKAVK